MDPIRIWPEGGTITISDYKIISTSTSGGTMPIHAYEARPDGIQAPRDVDGIKIWGTPCQWCGKLEVSHPIETPVRGSIPEDIPVAAATPAPVEEKLPESPKKAKRKVKAKK